jgi:site-specific recombinase XerD
MNITDDAPLQNKVPEFISIQSASNKFLAVIKQTRSRNTHISYTKGIGGFLEVISLSGINVLTTSSQEIKEECLIEFLDRLNQFSPATEQLYSITAARFYNFLMAERLADINLARVREIIKMRTRRTSQRLPQFPRTEIEQIISHVLTIPLPTDDAEILRCYRDRAFLVVLADTGLRVHEACNLKRGDVDWNEGRAAIIGKGNKEAVIRFSTRSLELMRVYLKRRSKFDGASGKPIGTLPIFARHDKGAGKKIKPITPTTGRNIVEEWVIQALGDDAKGRITPHSFRHYFVTTVLRASGNLKLAQELARHTNISVTQRYAHLSNDELDQGYSEIFDKK